MPLLLKFHGALTTVTGSCHFYATGTLTSASEEIIAGQLGTRTLRSGDKIFFKAYNRDTGQENLDINAWLNSF